MNKKRALQVVYALCLGGLILHLKSAFGESSLPINSISIRTLVMSIIPYLIIFGLRKEIYGALCAGMAVFIIDFIMHLEVFVWPGSSTSSVGLYFLPLWNIILVVPFSFLAGYCIEHFIEKRQKKMDTPR